MPHIRRKENDFLTYSLTLPVNFLKSKANIKPSKKFHLIRTEKEQNNVYNCLCIVIGCAKEMLNDMELTYSYVFLRRFNGTKSDMYADIARNEKDSKKIRFLNDVGSNICYILLVIKDLISALTEYDKNNNVNRQNYHEVFLKLCDILECYQNNLDKATSDMYQHKDSIYSDEIIKAFKNAISDVIDIYETILSKKFLKNILKNNKRINQQAKKLNGFIKYATNVSVIQTVLYCTGEDISKIVKDNRYGLTYAEYLDEMQNMWFLKRIAGKIFLKFIFLMQKS